MRPTLRPRSERHTAWRVVWQVTAVCLAAERHANGRPPPRPHPTSVVALPRARTGRCGGGGLGRRVGPAVGLHGCEGTCGGRCRTAGRGGGQGVDRLLSTLKVSQEVIALGDERRHSRGQSGRTGAERSHRGFQEGSALLDERGREVGGGVAGSLRSARAPGQRGRDARTEVLGEGCPAVAAHSEGLGGARPRRGAATKPLSFRFDVGPVWLGRHRVVRVVRQKLPVGVHVRKDWTRLLVDSVERPGHRPRSCGCGQQFGPGRGMWPG